MPKQQSEKTPQTKARKTIESSIVDYSAESAWGKRKFKVESRGYHYMLASTESLLRGFNIAVKYENNSKYEITKESNGFKVTCQDRTLFFSRGYHESEKRHIANDADLALDLDIFHNKSWLGNAGFNFAMVNASSMTQSMEYKDWDKEAERQWPFIVADSGGFQLNTGAKEFLDPKLIVEAHNKCCDIGITLDIPINRPLQEKLLPRAARIQRWNNEVMLKHKRPSLSFLNTIHGHTFYAREKYREVVENESLDRLAIGGVKVSDLTPLALTILKIITTGKVYKQYHVLGVSGLERWIVLSYIGHKKLVPLITSDSSSYIQAGINFQYFDPLRLLTSVDIRTQNKSAPKYAMLPCSCDVCSAIKYVRPYIDRKLPIGFGINTLHNLLVSKQYLDDIWEMTKLPKSEILGMLKGVYAEGKIKTIRRALDAIDLALDTSVEKAASLYSPDLLDKWPRVNGSGLFASVSTPMNQEVAKRIGKVLDTYEDYHGLSKAKK